MPGASSHDDLNDTNVEPSAAPAGYAAKVDGPIRRRSSSRNSEDLPNGERAVRLLPYCLEVFSVFFCLGRKFT